MLPKYSTVLYGSHCTYYSYIYYILMMIKGSCIIRLAGAKYIEYQELRNIAWRGGEGKGWNSNTVVKLLFESYLISTKGLNTHYSSAFKLWSH